MHSSLARYRRVRVPSTAFPTRQLMILALCRLCEPIAFMSIFPYVYYMVQSFHITNDGKQTAMYAGMVTSAFAFAEFSTGVVWGRISDKFGRKPVLLCGLAGTGISMLVFGFSPNITTALIARALGGLLNGNIGVINTTVAEFVTVKAHQPRAFSIMPSVWCIGSIIGAGLGGTLADPVRNYPAYFETNTIFDKFPYLLPNIICCFVVLISLTIGFLFLEETHEEKKYRRDVGLEIGDWILSFFGTAGMCEKGGLVDEGFHLLVDGQLLEYSSTESSPALSPISTNVIGELSDSQSSRPQARMSKKDLGFCASFNKRVLIIIISYGILAYHTISAEQLLPVLLSLPKSNEKPDLPFRFLGGFELSTKYIGYILSSQGFIQTISTLIVFPFVTGRLGPLATFRLSALTYPLLYLVVPYVTVLPDNLRMPALYIIVVWKVTAQSFAFPPLQILLANSAKSNKVLGTLNGTAASSASLCRAIGPTLSGFIQSAGLSVGSVGMPWWANCLVAIIGALLSLSMTSSPIHEASEKEAQEIEEAAYDERSLVAGELEHPSILPADADLTEEPLTLDRRP